MSLSAIQIRNLYKR